MAGSRYQYVKEFEVGDSKLLPETWIVIRLDGKGFSKLSSLYNFEKPNDLRALNLMNEAAMAVIRAFPEILIAYGESDETSFVLSKQSTLYGRRAYKIISTITSTFTASYIANWPSFFPTTPLSLDALPTFDGRAVCYPTEAILRDYLSWRQVDTHINNLYNTAFWALVQQGEKSTSEAHSLLKNTSSAEKNELLFSQFGINYNNIPEQYRKGSVIVRLKQQEGDGDGDGEGSKSRLCIKVLHVDIIQDEFWNLHPEILRVD